MMIELKEKIFNEEMNEAVVHEALRWYEASRRRGTHSAKTRSEVSGGGIKPWRQKGTGRARAGSIRSPLWRKGGVVFPPKPRDYSYDLPRKMRKLALRVALSDFNRRGRVKVFDQFSFSQRLLGSAPKTREGVKFLKEAGVEGKILVVLGGEASDFQRGIRNIEGVKVMLSQGLNLHDLLNADWLLLDRGAVAQLKERLS